MAMSTGGKWGCGCLTVILIYYAGLPIAATLIKGTLGTFLDLASDVVVRVEKIQTKQHEKEASAREAAEAAKKAEENRAAAEAQAKAVADREDRLRTFALKEAAALWQTYQALGAQIAEQEKRIDELRKTLIEFDKNPDVDTDYKAILAQREEMIGTRASLHKKLEDAYLAFRKFEATPSHKEYDELRRRVLEDGIREADEAAHRFATMRKEK